MWNRKKTRVAAGVRAATAPIAPGEAALGPLAGYVGYALRRAQSASFRHLERTAAELALTPGQFSLLTAIDANPGLNQRRLAAIFTLDKSTLSPAIDALAARDLVLRTRASDDARAWALTLTPGGRHALARMRGKVEAQERVIAGVLGVGERQRLVAALRRIEAALDAANEASGTVPRRALSSPRD